MDQSDTYSVNSAAPPVASGATKDGVTAGGLLTGVITAAIFAGALGLRPRLVFGLVVLAAVFIPVERVFGLRPQRVFRRGWATDLVHFVADNFFSLAGIAIVVIVMGTLLRAAVPAGFRTEVHRQSALLQFVEAILLAEVGGYWGHRAAHRVPFLWRFHRVHHSIAEMDWLASGRVHPIDQVFLRSCSILPIVAFGFTRATFGAFLAVSTLQAIFVHANVRWKFGPLRWLVSTPEFHHWHHANDPVAYNSNFAGEFPWIDALFGTLHLPRNRMPVQYGIADAVPDGYLHQLAWPMRRAGRPTELVATPSPAS